MIRSVSRTPQPAARSFSFSGHETFALRYGWLTKAVEAVGHEPDVFSRDDAIVRLGVGKNMVRSIRHWGLATGILEEEAGTRGGLARVSELGRLLFLEPGGDPYLEDPATLWLLHWQLLVHPQRLTTWSWTFSSLPSVEFTKEYLVAALIEAAKRLSRAAPREASVRRDVDVFVRTYVLSRCSEGAVYEDSFDCPLAELELLEEVDGVYRLRRGPKPSLPEAVFAFAVTDYWTRTADRRETLSFSDLCYGENSPGACFKLDENSLIDRLEGLEAYTDGDLLYADTSGLKQLYRRVNRPRFEFLKRHYEEATVPDKLIGV
ncbi:MAG TPA: DUF4007 domain-containing protein [Propionibacteriaceae bacterium]|nr:DUF4007 domain-containing protein [Propionibacteriaceae bacterium]